MGLYAISPFGRFRLIVRTAVEEIRDGDGRLVREGKPALAAQFTQGGGIPEYAKQVALERLTFRGQPETEDPFIRLGWFDLDLAAEENDWNDEQKQAVKDKLELLNGGEDFLIVEQQKSPAPYALYDQHRKVVGKRTVEHAIADITAAYGSAGFDVDAAVAYEQQNGNDERVIAALNALRPSVEEDEAEPLVAA